MHRIIAILGIMLFALSGCAGQGGQSVLLALAPPQMKEAFDALAQRTPSEIAESERVVGTLAAGQAGYFMLATGKPIVFIRSKTRPGWIGIWMTDRIGHLINIEGKTGQSDGRLTLINPTVVPWPPGEETKASKLYAQVTAKLGGAPLSGACAWTPRPDATGTAAASILGSLSPTDQGALCSAVTALQPDTKSQMLLGVNTQPVAILRHPDPGFEIIYPLRESLTWIQGSVTPGRLINVHVVIPAGGETGRNNLAMAYTEIVGKGQIKSTSPQPQQEALKIKHKAPPVSKQNAVSVEPKTPAPAAVIETKVSKSEAEPKAEVTEWNF